MSTTRNPERRRFLKTLGAGTAAAGLVQLPLPRAEADTPPPAKDERPRLYRETAHIRAYYATLRD